MTIVEHKKQLFRVVNRTMEFYYGVRVNKDYSEDKRTKGKIYNIPKYEAKIILN